MKCLKHVEDDGIIRVRNDQALSLTDSGLWSYCCKQEWKLKVRDVDKKEVKGIRKASEDDREVEPVKQDMGKVEAKIKKMRRTK